MKGFLKAVAFAGLLVATGAQAADLSAPVTGGGYKDEVVADTWWNAGDIFVRVDVAGVLPQTSTSSWNPAIPGANASITDSVIPEVTIDYFLTKNIAVELMCCLTEHTINASGSIAGLGKIGDSWLFPPTLLLQYHFDGFGAFKPYVGAGVNYTVFFDESAGPNFNHLKIDNAWGAAVQVGLDYHLTGNWFANIDFKYIWLDTDASVKLGTTPISTHVDIDPIIVAAGVGYRFGGYVPLK
ncbi:MAG: OmpW/AlkL family protein [Rhodomicrobium sp.]